jgi:hypothetical protein
MSVLRDIQAEVKEYSDDHIKHLMQKYDQRKYNICMKMEHGIYTQKQADKNYERAAKIWHVLWQEKHDRMMALDASFTAAIAELVARNASLGVLVKKEEKDAT